MKLFEIFGEVKIDDDGAIKQLGDVDKKAEKTSKSFGKSMKSLGKFAAKAAVGIGAVTAGLGAIATKTASAGDRIDKMSQKLGLSREGFQEWDYILSQNGASIDSMGAGMKTLTNQFDELSKGGQVATEAFDALGLSYEDLEGLTQEEIFEKTIVALQGMEDETKRAAIANDLLGKSGQELAPLLNAGADSVEALKVQAKELGIIMGDDAIDASVKFTDTMDNLKRSFGAVGLQIGTALMPIFQKLADWVIDNMPNIQKFFSEAFDVAKVVVSNLFDFIQQYLLPIFKSVFDWVVDNLPSIQETFSTVFGIAKDVISGVWSFIQDNLLPIFKDMYGWVEDNMPLFESLFEAAFTTAKDVGDKLMTTIGNVWDVMQMMWEIIEPILEKIGPSFVDAFGIITSSVLDGINRLTEFLTAFLDVESKLRKSDPAKGWATDIGGNILEKFGVSQEKIENFKSNFGVRGFEATGGAVYQDSPYVVGETGRELFIPNTNGTIVNNKDFENMMNAEPTELIQEINPITVETMIVREEADIQKIARELHNLNTQRKRGLAY